MAIITAEVKNGYCEFETSFAKEITKDGKYVFVDNIVSPTNYLVSDGWVETVVGPKSIIITRHEEAYDRVIRKVVRVKSLTIE